MREPAESSLALEAAIVELARDLPLEVRSAALERVVVDGQAPRPRLGCGLGHHRRAGRAILDFATRPWCPERRARRH